MELIILYFIPHWILFYHYQILGGVWYMEIGGENRYLIHFFPYSYVWINVKNVEMK